MNPFPALQTPVRALLGLVVLAAALWLGVRLLQIPTPSQAFAEVDLGSLTLQEGRLVRQGSTAPFTGTMTERYANGSLKSRSAVSNGLLEGLSEGWHTNGQKQVEEHFQAGISHGPRLKWYPEGQRHSEVMVVMGKLDGVFRRWHENGTLAEEIPMKQGLAEGVSRAFYANGCLQAEARLQSGKVLDRHLWKDGERPPPILARAQTAAVATP